MSKTPIDIVFQTDYHRTLSNVELWMDPNTKDYFFRLEYDIDNGRYKEIFPKVHTGLKQKDPLIYRPDMEPYYTSLLDPTLYNELEILTGNKGGLLICSDEHGCFRYIEDAKKSEKSEPVSNKVMDAEPDQNPFDYFKKIGSDVNLILQAFEGSGLSRDEALNVFTSLSCAGLEARVDGYTFNNGRESK